MIFLNFELIHEELVNFASTETMQILNKKENMHLKKKATKLIFQSHNLLIKKYQTYNDLIDKIIFYQRLSDFLNYLYFLEKNE